MEALAVCRNGDTDVRLECEELESLTKALAYFVRDYQQAPPAECQGRQFSQVHNVALHFRALVDNHNAAIDAEREQDT